MTHARDAADGFNVLVIDDDEDHRALIAAAIDTFALQGGRPRVHLTADPARAIELMGDGGEWIVLCDQSLDGARGTDWLPRLTACDAGPVIVTTSQGDERLVREAFERGAAGYLSKDELLGLDHERARRTIDDARRHWRLDRRTRELSRSLARANDELRRRNLRLRRISASTQRFMEDVAHDLRGPLASIGCYAEMVAEGIAGPVTAEQARSLALIRSTAADLHGMVEDFLDTSRIHADTVTIDRRALDVQAKIETVVGSIAPLAEQHDVRIEIDVEASVPPAYADPARVRRVLQNLLANAIKHGGTGSTVRLHARRDGDWVRVAVIDRGPGIEPAIAARIFDRFRSGSTSGRATDGLGLGLSIALDFTRASLGRLELDTTEGEGATLTFLAPVAEDGPVRRAAERRWRQDEGDHGLWIELAGVTSEHERAVRSWLATQLGATGVVLPTRRGERLRAGRPGLALDEWVATLKAAQAERPAGDPVHESCIRPIGCLACRDLDATGDDDVVIEVHRAAGAGTARRDGRTTPSE